VIARHFPALGPPGPATYAAWFSEVCRRTAVTIAHWMRVGFVHGVMNTDNMSILGLTIDYGPYGWLEPFDVDFTPNTTDATNRRYRYANQPSIGQWNLAQLARALEPLGAEARALTAGLEVYRRTFARTYRALMLEKIGVTWAGVDDDEGDDELLRELLALFALEETDFTIGFRVLAEVPLAAVATATDVDLVAPLAPAFYRDPAAATVERWAAWLRRYAARVAREPGGLAARTARMARVNPVIVLRNYVVQGAIEAAEAGDLAPVHRLLTAARRPYDADPAYADLVARRPPWARNAPGCAALSCSS
jgi:uncharacterized protein YdiU (UPF0061 family)